MPDIGDLLQARIRATFCGQPIINSFSFVALEPFATWSDAAQTLLDSLEAALGITSPGSIWVTGLNVSYAIQSIDIVDIYPAVAPLHSFPSSGVGTIDDDDALPPNDSLCCTLRSDFKGTGARGRVYLTGFSEGTQNAGYWLAGTQVYAQVIMSAMIDNFGEAAGGASFRWAVLHRYTGGAPIVPPEVKPIMSYTVHNEVRSMGRRAIGRRVSRRTVVGP